jgi:TonB family protein
MKLLRMLAGVIAATWLLPTTLPAQAFAHADSAWAWYTTLPAGVQTAIAQQQRLGKGGKDTLLARLPLRQLDLQAVGGSVPLSAIRACTSLERLALPYFADSLAPLTDGSFRALLVLDAAGSTLQSRDLYSFDLPALRLLNIAETDIRDLGFLQHFPALDTLIIAHGQLDEPSGADAHRRYKQLFILYRGVQRLLPRRFTQAELTSWIAGRLSYPAEALTRQVQGRLDVQFTVLPSGRVSALRLASRLGAGLDEEALRVVGRLRFEPGPSPLPRTAYIYFKLPR